MRNVINYILLPVILIFYNGFMSYSQLTVDAGPDQVVCVNLYDMDTITLGGNPTASGGTGSYTYCWETLYHLPYSQYYWYASFFLNDTTIPNPTVIHKVDGEEVTFKLTVIDDSGHVSIDSVMVVFSIKIYAIGTFIYYIYPGDSVLLDSENLLSSSLPIDSIAWSPTNGLSDPYNTLTWAKPSVSTNYRVYIIDTAGCEAYSAESINVNVITSGIGDLNEDEIILLYNPYSNTIVFKNLELNGITYQLRLYLLNGKMIYSNVINIPVLNINLSKGHVVYTIFNDNKKIKTGKILINK